MSDENPAAQAQSTSLTRSSFFRLIYATHFKTRVGNGDCTVQFAVQTDSAGAPVANMIQEEVSIVLAWPALKLLAEQLSLTVEAVEKEVGAIPSIPTSVSAEKFREKITDTVRGLKLNKRK